MARKAIGPKRPTESAKRLSRKQRLDLIVRLFEDGATLGQIGERVGLTPAGVHWIVKESGKSFESGAVRRRRASWRRADEVVDAMQTHRNARKVAELLGMQQIHVEEIARERLPLPLRQRVHRTKPVYTDDEILDCLRQASRAVGEPMSMVAYDNYARDQVFEDGRSWPLNLVVTIRFNTWRVALATAGVRSHRSSGVRSRFDREQCLDAVREVAARLGRIPSSLEYERAAKESSGDLPSLSTVRIRCGRWHEVIDRASCLS